MNALFYIAALVAVLATGLVITRANAVHALLYLIVSLFAVALIFFTLGAPFVAALEVIVYAGAILVLFVFAVMILGLGPEAIMQERQWMNPSIWIGPAILSLILVGALIYVIASGAHPASGEIGPHAVGMALFGPYALAVELGSMLLLAGLIGACHLGRKKP